MRGGLEKDRISDAEYENLLAEVEKWRAVEKIADIIWSVDMNLKFTYVSPVIEKLLGYSREEVVEMSLDELVTAESLSLIMKTLDEALKKEESNDIPPPIDIEAKHRDGTSVWFGLSRVFIRNKNGIPVGIIGVARNISDLIKATLALRESEAKYRALAEKSVVGIVIAQDAPVRLSYINSTMEKILGYSREELANLKGEETAKLIHPDDRADFFKKFKARLEGLPTPHIYEFRAIRKSGEPIWLEVHGTKIEYESEPAVLATFFDITDRHQAQEDMEKAKNLAEFLIDLMSHDLNNIHQGMMTAIELLSSREDFPAEDRTLIESLLAQLNRAGGLITKVKTLSDVQSKTVEKSKIDIWEPINSAVKSVRQAFPGREITVNSNVEPDMYFVSGCRFIPDVFYNLLHNAVKFDSNETVILDIHIGISSDDTTVQVSITDRGPGIPDSMKKDIFGRLRKMKSTQSGIGLTLVHQIIDICQGQIMIEDRVSGNHTQGSKFIIRLPKYSG